jgi:hypothetical protein
VEERLSQAQCLFPAVLEQGYDRQRRAAFPYVSPIYPYILIYKISWICVRGQEEIKANMMVKSLSSGSPSNGSMGHDSDDHKANTRV